MKTVRFGFLATFVPAACVLAAASPARADGYMAPPAPTISKVVAAPFQLHQAFTRKISDTVSQSLYKGDTTLTVTPPTAGAAPQQIPVHVELMTTTTLNANGDGMTDGALTMVSQLNRQIYAGSLSAVNEDFGVLTGTVDARLVNTWTSVTRLRADFHGVFEKDASGAWTIVNVDAHGVMSVTTRR